MATTEKYTTVIELNSEQAKRNLDELRKKVESWKSALAEAREKKMDRGFIAAIKGGVRGRVHTNTQHLNTNTHFFLKVFRLKACAYGFFLYFCKIKHVSVYLYLLSELI